ncbi:hypothetical protein Pst134EA_033027 [Puccinia striiformis f. sp. tritici]|uniref:hypothetical protein n=1 Tax=Puccinia striiformis f. sp. tritici TaxID=168172 RepID=UPI002008D8A7|nr:hypothetical protein Pst134EA_033027 [Puccinia striiformis f. sp. tritici]KAH9459375.1 hypothetical protein Pst134EA_033027 [Puccinia striiformis f. sp. tritici]KAI9610594.1 hypothetical protein H4Q26_006739 [Puccinia striiformis f. sp. tritici PST-130]
MMANPLSLRSKSLTLPPVQLQHINQRQPFSQVVTPGLKREEEGEGQEESPALNTSNLSYFPVARSAAYSRIPGSSEEGELPDSTSKKHSTRLRVIRIHPIALLPAFILGIITSLYVCLQDSSSPSWSRLIFKQQHFNPKTEPVINHRDHIYLPYDYLNHTWTLNPSKDQYPILQLIHNASLAWNDKLNRQSKNIQDAVVEYQRRYQRKPPKGFLEWFNWAQENQVKLVDEFDRVNELIEPFWAIPPNVLRNRTEEAGKNEAFSTFIIKDGTVKPIGSKKDVGRTIDQLKLLEVIVPHLPDVNVTMSHHDGPSVFMDWKTKQRHLDHARAGKVLPPELIDRVEDDASLWGFVGACSPDSPMRMLANGLGQELKVQHAGPGGYIGLDHSKTMDLCQHPEWQEFHGFTAWAGPRPLPLRPIFSFAQSPGFVSDILNAPLEQFEDSTKNADQVKKWEDKLDNQRLLWRGQTTGVWFDRQTNWRKSHRVRLHRLGVASKHPYGHQLKRKLRTPALIYPSNNHSTLNDHQVQVVVVEKEYSLAQLSDRYLSASFVGDLVQCTVEDSSCETISKEIEFADPVDWQFQNNFKYVLDVDGNSWSGRFRRLLKSNSLVFKSTIWPEWYRDQIQPWYHYIPVRIDYEEIFDLMSFFTGAPSDDHQSSSDDQTFKTEGFDHLAKSIAQNGSLWADEHFRYQDIRAYVWRTYLEWARVSSDDRDSMNFEL